jgi:hypothetical protein
LVISAERHGQRAVDPLLEGDRGDPEAAVAAVSQGDLRLPALRLPGLDRLADHGLRGDGADPRGLRGGEARGGPKPRRLLGMAGGADEDQRESATAIPLLAGIAQGGGEF